MIFCQDSDLLYYNNPIFTTSQIGPLIVSAAGTLSGNVITSPLTPDLLALDVQPGQVVSLTGVTTGQFPILGVTSSTLTFSLLTSGLYPDDGSPGTPIPPYIDSGTVNFTVRTLAVSPGDQRSASRGGGSADRTGQWCVAHDT